MAFQNRKLAVISYANGFTLWHYKSKDDTLAVIKDNYFPVQVQSLMAVGDIMIINAKDFTSILCVDSLSPIKLVALR